MPFWKTEMKELAPGVFAYVQADGTWFVSNAGLIIGKEDQLSSIPCQTKRGFGSLWKR